MTAPADVDPPTTSPPSSWRRSPRRILVAMIVVHAVLLFWSACANSVAFDEYAHLPAGASYVKYREFGMLNLTPPLVRVFAALPPLAAGAEVPSLEPYAGMVQKDRYWAYAEAFLRANSARYHRLFVLARLPMIAISCVGAWLVFRWASDLYGDRGGLLAACVYALCPNLAAHASLVGTDAPIAVAVCAAAYLWWRYCRTGSWRALAGATLMVGIAHLCKCNAVLLWPVMIAMSLATRGTSSWRRTVRGLAIACGGAIFVFNAGYLFEGTLKPAGNYALRSHAMSAIFARLPLSFPIPFPEQSILGFDALKWEVEQGFPGYLFGEQYRGSKWYYFPAALLLKLPLPTLALLTLAAVRRRIIPDEFPITTALAVFFLGMILVADVNLGVRYILPVLPFAFILTGRLADAKRARWIVPSLLTLLALANLSVAPRYLTFFNVLAGGSSRGQFLLNDSNFDWGQGLIDLKKWMTANDVPSIQLGYFGRVDPGVYGINYHLLTEIGDEPYIAVSSYYLAGLPHRLPSSTGPTGWFQLECAEQLRRKPRVATVAGGTIHIFTRGSVAEAIEEARLAPARRPDAR